MNNLGPIHIEGVRLNKRQLFLSLALVWGWVSVVSAQVPAAPSGIATMSPYNGQVNLIWQAVPAATSYAVARDPYYTPTSTYTAGGPVVPTNTPVPTSTPIALVQASALVASTTTPVFTDFQVTDGIVYQYSIWGVNASGNGPSAQVTALPYTAPAAISPSVQNIHNNSLDLSWGIPLSTFPVASYNIYRQTSATIQTGNTMPVSTFLTAVPTFVATVMTPSYSDQQAATITGATSIFYTVLGVDSNGVTGSYPTVTTSGALPKNSLPPATPFLSGYVPAVTPTMTPNATPVYGVQLFWNPPVPVESVTEFQVLSNSTPIATILVPQTPTPTFYYLDTTILPVAASGPASAYSVVSVNANGPVTSNIFNGSITRPSMNGGMTVTANPTNDAVTITWIQGNPGTYGITGYKIYKGMSGAPPVPYPNVTWLAGTPSPTSTPSPFATIIETPSQTQTLIAVDTVTDSNNTYWVQPFYGITTTPTATIVVLGDTVSSTQNWAPTPVTNVTANQISNTNNQVNISWSGALPGLFGTISHYAIYRALNGGTPTMVSTVSASRSSRNDYVDVVTGTAAYAVGAIDNFGNISDLSVLSNTITLSNVPGFVPKTPVTLPAIQTATSMTQRWILNPSSDNITSYQIYGSDYPTWTIPPTPIYSTGPTATPFTSPIPSFGAATPYYLVAYNSVGGSQAATLSAISVPAAYNVTAVVQTPTQGVSVSWYVTPVPDATPNVNDWVVYRASTTPVVGEDLPYRPIATVPVGTTGYLDTAVTPGVFYSYWVTERSVNPMATPIAESAVSIIGSAPGTLTTWPNAPGGLTANTGSGATTLFWLNNLSSDGVVNYTVFRNATPTCTVAPAATLSAVFPETPGVVATYQVVANNPSGPSNSSVTLVVFPVPSITPVVSMNTPMGYSVIQTPTPGVWISGVTFPSGAAQECTVYRSTDPGFSTYTSIGVLNSGTTVLSDSAPVTGYINYYKFVSDNGAGVTASFTLSGILGVNVWPNPPGTFTASAGSAAVTLNWTAPVTGTAPVTAYEIYRSLNSGTATPYTTPTVIPFHTGPYIDNQVAAGTPYFYYMDDISAGLKSAPTSQVAVMPGPPLALSGTAGVSQVILNWSQATQVTTPGFSSYAINRLALATPISTVATQNFSASGITTTTYTDTSAGYSTAYVYQVAPVAVATTGENVYGPFSNSVTLTVPPQGPATLSAVSGDQIAQLRWSYQGTVAAAAYTYTIQRKLGTAPTSSFQTIVSGLTGLDYTDTGLLDKTLYNYQILAIDPHTSLIGYSPIANALPAHPPVVDNPNLTLVQSQSGNTISWTAANSGVTDFNPSTMYPLGGYHVYRSSDGGGSYQLLNPPGTTTTSYTDDVTIINGTTYTYLVKAFDAPPNVNTSDPNMVHETTYNTITANGLTASVALDRNSIRPYGASNEQQVHIRFVVTNPSNVTIKVYSISGVFIKQLVSQYFNVGVYGVGGNYPLQWDGRNANGDLVASGVYMITTEMNGLQDIEKIAVIK